MSAYEDIDSWIDAHFDEEVRFLQALVRVPTDTPPGDNAPHAGRTKNKLTRPDYVIAGGFGYQVIVAHNGCLQLEVTVHGQTAHAAIPDTGVDALQGAVAILNALYAQNLRYKSVTSRMPGITHPYLNVGRIEGGTNTNVVPGKVVLKLDRRMIPEENPAEVEASIRKVIADAAATCPGIAIEIKRLLLANSMQPLPGN